MLTALSTYLPGNRGLRHHASGLTCLLACLFACLLACLLAVFLASAKSTIYIYIDTRRQKRRVDMGKRGVSRTIGDLMALPWRGDGLDMRAHETD
ncbi:uncharacterized protein F4817DRAFT_342184, partial [Daldinia loculata]|uniref:uncharacterized protein n=1 Tax=Daldinia loculata TaxID=103429 RepID=UPI0020C1EAD6